MWFESFWSVFCLTQCCSEFWMPNNVTEFGTRLKQHLIGQPLAHEIILDSIRSHITMRSPSKSLVLSLHGSTGTGKNFIAKHLVESLYRDGYKSKFVRFYVVSRDFMHDDPVHISQYKDRLTEEIETTTKRCSQSVFIFDEIDLMPKQLLDVILYYIDFHVPTTAQPIDFRRTIFIFLSNTGGQLIIEATKQLHKQSIRRENFPILRFQELLRNASLNEKGGLWHTGLVERHLITFFVPFLPLELEHVRQCIEIELRLRIEEEEFEYEFSKDKLVDRVLDLIEMDSSSSLIYSLSGCKRAQQKLNFVFEGFRQKSSKTEKKISINRDQL